MKSYAVPKSVVSENRQSSSEVIPSKCAESHPRRLELGLSIRACTVRASRLAVATTMCLSIHRQSASSIPDSFAQVIYVLLAAETAMLHD